MFALPAVNAGMLFVDRGDPSSVDFAVGDFTKDDTWRDLDLSSIVPAGAKGIIITCDIVGSATNQPAKFRKKSNSNTYNVLKGYVGAGGGRDSIYGVVFCDVDRVIQYLMNSGLSQADFTVCGWYI